jgi:hypothetical protein
MRTITLTALLVVAGACAPTRAVINPPVPAPAWTQKTAFYRLTDKGMVLYAVGVLTLDDEKCVEHSTVLSAASNRAKSELSKLLAVVQEKGADTLTTNSSMLMMNVRDAEAWYDGDRNLYVLARLELPDIVIELGGDRVEDQPAGGKARAEVGGWVRRVYAPMCK